MEKVRWSSQSLRPLRGRNDHVRRIVEILDVAVKTRRCKILLLESPVGSGKSRLLLESMLLADRRGYAVIDGLPEKPRVMKSSMTRACQLESQIKDLLRRGPVLVAVDDLQWVDTPSVEALLGLVDRFAGVPLVWEFALRPGGLDDLGGYFFKAMSRDGRAEWLQPLGALSESAIAEVVGDLLDAEPSQDLVRLCECFDATPQVTVQLIQGLVEDGAIEANHGVAKLKPEKPDPYAGETIMAPACLASLVSDRLSGLRGVSREALQVAAVLGRVFCPEDLSEMLGCSPAELVAPLSEAVAAGLIVAQAVDFAFPHDLIRRAVLGSVPAPLVPLLHRQAAAMLVERNGGHTERSAVHLLHGHANDAEAAGIIARIAERLMSVAPESAATLALRGMEKAPKGSRVHLRMAGIAVVGLLRSGSLARAAEIAEQVMRDPWEGAGVMVDRVRAGLITAMALRGETDGAFVLASNSQGPADGRAVRRTQLVRLALSFFSHIESVETTLEGILSDSTSCPASMTMAAMSIRATVSWRRGKASDALCAIEESVDLWQRQSGDSFDSYPLWQKAWMLLRMQELDAADSAIEALGRVIESSRTEVLVPVYLSLRGWCRLARGDVAGAEVDGSDALSLCYRYRMQLPVPWLHAFLACTALRRGELGLASDCVQRLDECLPHNQQHPLWGLRCLIRAQVSAAGGEPGTAFRALLDAGDSLELIIADPASAAWCVRLARSVGHESFARDVVRTSRMISELNPDQPFLAVVADHCRALMDRDAVIVKSLAGQYTDPWVHASATEDAGVLLAAVDRAAAVAELSAAMAVYVELGADWDAARVRHRLRDLGVRRRHWSHTTRASTGWASLTIAEEKVARLAAGGLTNRQVARELFISAHTVGFHLRQIYRKLEIRSRVDLARIAPPEVCDVLGGERGEG